MTVNYGGRPTVMTIEVLQKLDAAFSNGCSNTEACDFADIAESTFYKYLEENQGYSEYVKALKSKPNRMARLKMVEKIKDGNMQACMWWLERKNKDEFATRVEDTGPDGQPHKPEVYVFNEASPRETTVEKDGNSGS